MKTFLLTTLFFFVIITGHAQAVLNEAYVEPGSGHDEFFELFNTSSSQIPENLDNYTVITYYEESGSKGFYVYDLPAISMSARSYFVSSCKSIFNIQGQTNKVADVSWNNLPASSSLTKWESNGTGYISKAISSSCTDFFMRKNGGGANYTILIFKNGVLVNGLLGGSSSTTIPAFLKAMPNLPVDMIAPSTDFIINFNAIADNQVEYVIAVPGTDNGYMRESDGLCGTWLKSSAQAQHTPGVTNGVSATISGSVIITSSVVRGLTPIPSYLSYRVTGGTTNAYPVTIEAYRDFGTIGQLDANDILFDSRVISNAGAGLQNINLIDPDDKVMIVVKSPAGCFDQVLAAYSGFALPVKLASFTAFLEDEKVKLNWITTSEINVSHFVIEKSNDGLNYTDAGIVFANGNETDRTSYSFTDGNAGQKGIIYYRLRTVDLDKKGSYSEVRIIRFDKDENKIELNSYPNPVKNELHITIPQKWQNKPVMFTIYTASGQVTKKIVIGSSSQTETINLNDLSSGFYIIHAICNGQVTQQKIIKR